MLTRAHRRRREGRGRGGGGGEEGRGTGGGGGETGEHSIRRPQHSVRRLPGSGQVQCTSWRNFAPLSSSTFKTIHGEQGGKRERGGSAVRARHIVREHDTTQPVFNKDIQRAQGVCPWSPSQEGARARSSSSSRASVPRIVKERREIEQRWLVARHMHVVLFKSPSPFQRCGEGTIGEIDNMLLRPKPGIMFSASQGSMRVWLEQLRACHAQTAVNHAVRQARRLVRHVLSWRNSRMQVM